MKTIKVRNFTFTTMFKVITTQTETSEKVKIFKIRKHELVDGIHVSNGAHCWFINMDFAPWLRMEYFWTQILDAVDTEFGQDLKLLKCRTQEGQHMSLYFAKKYYPEFSVIVEEDKKHYTLYIQRDTKEIKKETIEIPQK